MSEASIKTRTPARNDTGVQCFDLRVACDETCAASVRPLLDLVAERLRLRVMEESDGRAVVFHVSGEL